ncbi:MAG: OB-fold nucleic acid binding domain-containing protein [Candidatus Woesearchaeota archaeon]
MIRITTEEIIQKIKEKTSYNEEAINEMINKKVKQLSGLITKEGAARIVANELGVPLFNNFSGKLKIKNILSGMRDVETVGIVKQNFGVKPFTTQNREGKLASLIIADETGAIRVVLWNEIAEQASKIKIGDIVKIKAGYVRDNNNSKEIHLNERSKLIINPPDEKVDEARYELKRKTISELSENDRDVELRATIVQVFEPKFYSVCPECGKKLVVSEAGMVCEQHGKVKAQEAYVINLLIDDGTGIIRMVCFKEQVLKLLNKSEEDLLILKDSPEKFEEIRRELLGTEIVASGRATLNKIFGRIEFVADKIELPDYKKEAEKLKKEVESLPPVEEPISGEPEEIVNSKKQESKMGNNKDFEKEDSEESSSEDEYF